MRKLFFTLVASIAATAPVYAEVFELPPEGYDVMVLATTISYRLTPMSTSGCRARAQKSSCPIDSFFHPDRAEGLF